MSSGRDAAVWRFQDRQTLNRESASAFATTASARRRGTASATRRRLATGCLRRCAARGRSARLASASTVHHVRHPAEEAARSDRARFPARSRSRRAPDLQARGRATSRLVFVKM